MIEAAKQAEAYDFILDLEDPQGRKGFDAHVGERGVKLSGGQRQRVSLARVILKNAPILVLDEATSALDSEVEAAIQGTLYGMMEGKTVIAIAHRLSTIARMDRIVVLDEGRIVEDGTHDALLQAGGLYANFWNRPIGRIYRHGSGGRRVIRRARRFDRRFSRRRRATAAYAVCVLHVGFERIISGLGPGRCRVRFGRDVGSSHRIGAGARHRHCA